MPRIVCECEYIKGAMKIQMHAHYWTHKCMYMYVYINVHKHIFLFVVGWKK